MWVSRTYFSMAYSRTQNPLPSSYSSWVLWQPLEDKPWLKDHLVGGFSPFEKYWSKWESSPNKALFPGVCLPSWWLNQPLSKILCERQNGWTSSPIFGVNIKKIFETTTQSWGFFLSHTWLGAHQNAPVQPLKRFQVHHCVPKVCP